jgi:hypothetical protein
MSQQQHQEETTTMDEETNEWSGSDWDVSTDDDTEDEKTPVIEMSAPLNPTQSTCYLDSILVSLFGPSDFDTTERLTMGMKDTPRSNRLMRTLLRHFERGLWKRNGVDTTKVVTHIQREIGQASTSDLFTSTQHQDAGQCLMTLLGVIGGDVGHSTTHVLVTGFSSMDDPNELGTVTSKRSESTGYLHSVDIDLAKKCATTSAFLISESHVSLESPGYCHTNGIVMQWFDRKSEVRRFVPHGSFAVNVARVKMDWSTGRQVLDSSQIVLDEFTTQGQSAYMLTACVLYRKRHYTCVFQHESRWFLYNDLLHGGVPQFVGYTWDEARRATSATTRTTILFYQVM